MDDAGLRLTLAAANAFKDGDLAVGGTRDDRLRDEARHTLLGTALRSFRMTRLVDDGVSEALSQSLDVEVAREIDSLTIGDVRSALAGAAMPAWVSRFRDGLTSEAIAACAKVMSDEELSDVCTRLFNPLPGNGTTIGAPRHLGSRIQPNSPGDSDEEILLSILEGLTYGCGDVILGLNPASDDVDSIVRLEELLATVVARLALPTRFCVLSDIVKQHQAMQRTRVDVGFQSLAGTSRALAGMVGLDVDGLDDLARSFDALYFETGQGSEVTNAAAEQVDMVTLEARTYGVARRLARRTGVWTIVNDVAGFIGPEVFRFPAQLERACLEDSFMAKLHGLTMGLDVCATFHMGISPAELRTITQRVVDRAAPAYLMAVAGNADPMLGYLTTSFREHPRLRRRFNRRMTSDFERRLGALRLDIAGGALSPGSDTAAQLYAVYQKAGGDQRSHEVLRDEGAERLRQLRDRGFDVGNGCERGYATPPSADARIDDIYSNARAALHATVLEAVIRDVTSRAIYVRTMAADREDYLAHPVRGERLRPADADRLIAVERGRGPRIQLVVSDGLNANAVNEHLRALLPPLRRHLSDAGSPLTPTDVIVANGRVRAGYHVGQTVDADAIVHVIGERPGTGLNTLSAYVTYGRDESGQSRWTPALDHSCTTAICGIHPEGRSPLAAADEIARTVIRALETRRSGIAAHQSR